MGSSLAYDNGIWGEPYRLFAVKFLFVGVFWFVAAVNQLGLDSEFLKAKVLCSLLFDFGTL